MSRKNQVRRGQGRGYKDPNGRVCMVKCFSCGKENWAPLISSGNCAWCDYNPNEKRTDKGSDRKHWGDGEE